ncbi:hypothetical protein JL722_3935 [Aureococcus anophagefferens]|nr:hypothetical protein JL722_3935 [Aureococcus anophagefferens]
MAMNLNMASGTSGMLKDGTTLADGADEAVLKNIGATKQLSNIVKTSLGPNGMKKLIINHLGKTLVSSDCATIARELEVVHPAAQMISLAAAAQDSEIGDGTNLVVSFAGELLKLAEDLLRTGLHTSEIVAGYELAYAECVKILPELVCDSVKSGRDAAEVAKVLEPVIAAKHDGVQNCLAKLIRMAKLRGGDVRESSVMKGLIVMRPSETTIQALAESKVAVFNCGLEMAQTETKGTVLIRSADELLNYNKTEERALEKVVKEIADSGARLVVSGGSVSEMAQHFLEKYELMCLKITSKFELRRICGATGATACVRLGAPTPEEMGSVSLATTKELGGRTVTVLEQSDAASSKIATVVLRASTASLLDDLERAVEDGVHTAQHAAGDAKAGVDLTPTEAATKNAAVLDAFAVKESALRLAVDAAVTVLRVDQIIMSKPAGGPKGK